MIDVQSSSIQTSFDWKPTANTLLYFPLLNDTSDHSWHWITLTNSWTKWNTWYVFTSTSKLSTTDYDTQIKYLWIWYKLNSVSETTNNWIFTFPYMWYTSYNAWQSSTNYRWKIAVNWANWTILWTTPWMSKWEWHHLAYIYDWTKVNISKDWIVTTIYNWSSINHRLNNPITLAEVNGSMNVEIWDVIWEKIVWSESDIQKYINKAKSRYWL